MKPNKNLEKLANDVLDLLAGIEEWNADILDEIAEIAMDLKLARLDENGMFERIN